MDVRPPKLAKRRRQLPVAQALAPMTNPGPASSGRGREGVVAPSVEEQLRRLPPHVLSELKALETSDKFMPGEVSRS